MAAAVTTTKGGTRSILSPIPALVIIIRSFGDPRADRRIIGIV